jgi:tetratricopeptide (TPR) repeat protein
MPELRNQLSLLESSGLIRVATLEPELEYLFRHALIQDAAYDSLLRADRKKLHRAVGAALEQAYPDREGEHVGIIAEHYLLGENWPKASDYLMCAADAAVARYSDIEARSYFLKALDALSHLPDSSDSLRQRADSLQKLVNASIMAEQGDVSMARLMEAETAARRLVAETDSAADKYLLAHIIYQMGHLTFWAGDVAAALSLFDQVMELAAALGDETLAVFPANISGQFQSIHGNLVTAVALLERARDGLLQAGNTVEIIACRGNLGWVLASMGRIEEGLAECRAGLKVAVETDNMTGLAIGNLLLGDAESVAGKLEQAMAHNAEGIRLARLSENPHYERAGLATGAVTKMYLGLTEEVDDALRRVEKMEETLGPDLLGSGVSSILRTWASLTSENFEAALQSAQEALQIAGATNAQYLRAFAEQSFGEALYRHSPDRWEEAEAHLVTSLDLHMGRAGVLDAARTHVVWARLCHDRGDAACAGQHFEAAQAIFAAAGADEELERLQQIREGSNG